MMGFLTRTCPLHSNLATHLRLSHSKLSPSALSGAANKTISLYRKASCNGNKAAPSQSGQMTKLQTTALELSSSFKRMLILSTPVLLVEFSLPPLATALTIDGLSSSQMMKFLPLAEIDPVLATLLIRILGPVFASLNFLFIIRIVMSWYPQLPVDKFPYIIAFAPTEPVLEPTRRLVPPVGGVDISPVIWVAIMSFLNEILLGQQGLLVLLSQQQGQLQ